MRTDLLTLAQWLSPAYPVGAFAYSHGLETAIETGQVDSADTLQDWIEAVLLHGSGRSDALFLAAAYHCDNPRDIDAITRAFAPSKERLFETVTLGTAFAKTTRDVWGIDLPDLSYPVAVGRAAALQNLPLEDCAAMFLQAFSATLVSVGQRLIPIGQTEAQRIVHDLSPVFEQIATDTSGGDLDGLSSTAFMADIAAMQHETQSVRVFRT